MIFKEYETCKESFLQINLWNSKVTQTSAVYNPVIVQTYDKRYTDQHMQISRPLIKILMYLLYITKPALLISN